MYTRTIIDGRTWKIWMFSSVCVVVVVIVAAAAISSKIIIIIIIISVLPTARRRKNSDHPAMAEWQREVNFRGRLLLTICVYVSYSKYVVFSVCLSLSTVGGGWGRYACWWYSTTLRKFDFKWQIPLEGTKNVKKEGDPEEHRTNDGWAEDYRSERDVLPKRCRTEIIGGQWFFQYT